MRTSSSATITRVGRASVPALLSWFFTTHTLMVVCYGRGLLSCHPSPRVDMWHNVPGFPAVGWGDRCPRPGWRNGIRGRLKPVCPQGHRGSTPLLGTHLLVPSPPCTPSWPLVDTWTGRSLAL